MVMPSILFGSFTFLTLKGLSTIGKGAIDLAPNKFTKFRAKYNAFKKGLTTRPTDEDSRFYWKWLKEILKTPSDLDSKQKELDNAFKDLSEGKSPPQVQFIPDINTAMDIFKEMHVGEGYETGFDMIGEFNLWYHEIGGDFSNINKAGNGDGLVENTKDKIEKFKSNIKVTENFKGFFSKKLFQYREFYSFNELLRLDKTIKELSEIEYEGLAFYDESTESINYNIFTSIDRRINDGEIINEIEKKIFEVSEFFNFDPFDSEVKYPLTSNENLDSKIFKTLLNLIYKNRDKIERAYKGNNIFGLAFKYDGTLHSSHADSSLISNSNLAKLLGINKDALGNYLKDLDGEDFNYGQHHQYNLRSIRNTLSKIFDLPTLEGAKAIIRNLIDNYFDLRYVSEENFIIKFLTYIDDYTTGKILSESSISEMLGYSVKYTRDFKKFDKGTYDKYFKFIVGLLQKKPSDLNFEEQSSFDDFTEEVQLLIYNQLVENKMIIDLNTRKMQFDAIVSTLFALTMLRYKDPSNLGKYITKHNPLGLYTLSQLSETVSLAGYSSLITDQLREGRPSIRWLGKVITELDKGIKMGIEECKIAKVKMQAYLKLEARDSQDFGNIFHDTYEAFTIQYVASKGGKSTYESKVNFPESNHRVDNIILRDKAFITNIEDHQNVVNIPEGIELITVDYTFTSNEDWIKDKFYKNYQAEDRFLIIVLLGEKNPIKVQKLRDMLRVLEKYDDGSKYFDHIQILTSHEYKKFLGVTEGFAKQFDEIEHNSFNIFKDKKVYDESMVYWYKSLLYLSTVSTEWINKYLPQR
ncbi:hypothetical protein LCGC14_1423410, partial [marine sediment metagenome]